MNNNLYWDTLCSRVEDDSMHSEGYEVPEDLYYSKDHEWARIEDDLAVVGITDYAQKSLHEIVYVELPSEGMELKQMDSFGTVESVKAVSEIFSPVSGEVVQVNQALEESPELVNKDPYGEGWIIKIRLNDLEGDLKNLMDAKQYADYLKKLESEEV